MNAYCNTQTTLREKHKKVRQWMVSTTFRVMLVCTILFFGFLYIWQTNTVSTKGYALTDLERKVEELKQENSRLQVEIAKHTSMQSVQQRLQTTDLVAITDVQYVRPVGTAVAKR